MTRTRGIVALLAVVALVGCGPMRNDKYCKWGIPAWGAAMGGVGAGLGVSEGHHASDGEIAGAAVGGTLVGAGLGALVAHFVCQAEQPPPPPAPVAAPPPPPARGTKLAEIAGPNFDFDKSTLTAEGKRRVEAAARILKDNPSIHASVEGHTDSVGSDAYNQRLSERRARAVAEVLVEDGIGRSRLDVRGLGESHPAADNGTAQGRARNRRVDIIVE